MGVIDIDTVKKAIAFLPPDQQKKVLDNIQAEFEAFMIGFKV
jgi:hypothetical protein